VLTTLQQIERRHAQQLRRVLRRAILQWSDAAKTLIAPLNRELARVAEMLSLVPENQDRYEQVFADLLTRLREINLRESGLFAVEGLDVKFLDRIERQVVIEFDNDFWQNRPEDGRLQKIWKGVRRYERRWRERMLNMGNFRRRLFRRPIIQLSVARRRVPLRGVIERDLVLPGARLIQSEWQQFLAEFARHFSELHQTIEDLKDRHLSASCESPVGAVQNGTTVSLPSTEKLLHDYETASRKRLRIHLSESRKQLHKRWPWAGTPFHRHRPAVVRRHWREHAHLEKKTADAWLNHMLGECDNWSKDIEIAKLQFTVRRRCRTVSDQLHSRIAEKIVPRFERGFETVSEAAEQFKSRSTHSRTDLRKHLTGESDRVLTALRTKELPAMVDVIMHSQFKEILRDHLRTMTGLIDELSAEHTIFTERDLDGPISKSRTERIPLRQLVEKEILPGLVERKTELTSSVGTDLDRILRDISEIDQIVEYNLETAGGILRGERSSEAVQEAERVAGEGLDRAANQFVQLSAGIEEIGRRIQEQLSALSREYISRLQDLQDNEKILQLRLRLMRASALERFREVTLGLWRRLRIFLRKMMRQVRKGTAHLTRLYRRFRRLTGLAPGDLDMDEKITLFLTDGIKRIESLPYVYQRLFRTEPLTDERFFTGRSKEANELKSAFKTWSDGQLSATLLVGEKGSGRTTLLNLIDNMKLTHEPLIKIQLANTVITSEEDLLGILAGALGVEAADVDELEHNLMEKEERSICVVEDMQNLYLRTVNGFDALERFLLLISRTARSVFWVVTCTLYTWRYLNRIVGVSKYFQKNIELGTLSGADIKELIMRRHRISGYNLQFEASEAVRNTRKYKKISTQEQREQFIQQLYFEQLHEAAAGNVAVAMLYWLISISAVEKDKLHISPGLNLDHSFLYKLPDMELFSLAALLQHESLTALEHSRIFNIELDSSRLLLQRMCNRNMLTCEKDRFTIHRLLFRPVVAVLKNRKIIH